jgi:hypothetical protein
VGSWSAIGSRAEPESMHLGLQIASLQAAPVAITWARRRVSKPAEGRSSSATSARSAPTNGKLHVRIRSARRRLKYVRREKQKQDLRSHARGNKSSSHPIRARSVSRLEFDNAVDDCIDERASPISLPGGSTNAIVLISCQRPPALAATRKSGGSTCSASISSFTVIVTTPLTLSSVMPTERVIVAGESGMSEAEAYSGQNDRREDTISC